MTTDRFKYHCILVTGIFPPDVGGPARYIPAIADSLQNREISCSVLTLGECSETVTGPFRFPVHYISRRLPVPIRMLVTAARLATLARSADVIFANGLYVEAAVAAKLARRPLVIKLVGDEVWERASNRGWTHGGLDDFQRTRGDWKIRFLRKLRAFTISSSNAVIVPSRYTAALVSQWAADVPPTHVVPNAVEMPPHDEHFRLRPEQERLRNLAFVGRLIPLKRIDGLLRAIAEMQGVGLVVVGDGPDRQSLQHLSTRLGLEQRVQFTGAVDQPKVAAVLAQCDAVILNSTTENCPHVVLEAMAMGLPVVATKVGGVPEIVEDGVSGLLVDPADPGELSAAIRRVLNNESLRTRLRAGARESSLRFSWEANVDAVADVLRGARG